MNKTDELSTMTKPEQETFLTALRSMVHVSIKEVAISCHIDPNRVFKTLKEVPTFRDAFDLVKVEIVAEVEQVLIAKALGKTTTTNELWKAQINKVTGCPMLDDKGQPILILATREVKGVPPSDWAIERYLQVWARDRYGINLPGGSNGQPGADPTPEQMRGLVEGRIKYLKNGGRLEPELTAN